MFNSIISCQTITKEEIISSIPTFHFRDDRIERMRLATELDEGSYIDASFIVDRNHPNGPEIHCVSSKGIIYILNERKFNLGYPALVTVLIARPNQVIRLYKECGNWAPQGIIEYCKEYKRLDYNHR